MPGTPETSTPPAGSVLAFDFGLRRIGVAVGQAVTGSATALETLANRAAGPDWERIDALVAEWRPAQLLVGMPTLADGRPGALAAAVEAFCGELGRYGLPVDFVDERDSSLEAGERLKEGRRAGRRGRIGKGRIDAAAAAIIAERWLAAAGSMQGHTRSRMLPR